MVERRRWTAEEKEYLMEKYGTLSIGAIAKNLNRTRKSIEMMRKRLKLGAFLVNGDYVTWRQLHIALGTEKSHGYKSIFWVKDHNFPMHKKKVGNSAFKVVYLEEFWKWAERNRSLLDFSKMEENTLGKEPDWAKEKRRYDIERRRKYITTPWTRAEDQKLIKMLKQKKYSYSEISKELRRTNGAISRRIYDLGLKEKPVKMNSGVKWTKEETDTLGELIKVGYSYEMIADKIAKSTSAIRTKTYSMYLTQNIDKAREIIGDGNWGDNRPERSIKHRNVMNPRERQEMKSLMIRLVTALRQQEAQNTRECKLKEGMYERDCNQTR